jgi:hypothetical protein
MFALQSYLWVAPHLLLAVVLFLVFRRGLNSRLWLFTVYLIFEILLFTVLFIVNWIRLSIDYYHWILIVGSSISDVVKFGLIYQLSGELVAVRPKLKQSLRSWYAFFFGMFFFCAVTVSATFPRLGVSNAAYLFRILDLSSSIVMVGLLLAYSLFMRIVGVLWRDWAFGLILGFGVFEGVSLISAVLRPELSSTRATIIEFFEMAAYHICVLIWLAYLLRAEPRTSCSIDKMHQSHLESWGSDLQRMIQ